MLITTTLEMKVNMMITLMKIIKNYNVSDAIEDEDPLLKIINGSDGDE